MLKPVDIWGMLGKGGRWGSDLRGNLLWSATLDSDPYRKLRMNPGDAPDWFDESMNARDVVARMIEENGDDLKLYFTGTGTNKYIRVVDRINDAVTGERCRLDPFFFLELYKSEYYTARMYADMVEQAIAEHTDHMCYFCINPTCHYFTYVSDHKPSIAKCRACGCMTSVNAEVIAASGVPDAVLMSLAVYEFHRIKSGAIISSGLFGLAKDSEYVTMQVYDYRPAARVSKNMPGLVVKGDHFIRGRANRESLMDAGADEWVLTPDYPPGHVEDQDPPPLRDLRLQMHNCNKEVVDILRSIIEDPKVFIDPSKAEKFREEYIDTRWDEEFGKFVAALVDDKILKVDSSGVNETLTTLYHMAQRRANKRTIIKKDGKIMFPTKKVLEHINPRLMKQSFDLTEHAQYTDAGQVFALDSGGSE